MNWFSHEKGNLSLSDVCQSAKFELFDAPLRDT